MLFHALYAPGSGVYVGQFGYVLEGPLDADALERAWQGVVGRHEALRAGFAWEGLPRPVQVIRRDARLRFRREDWRGLDEAERQARLERFLEEDRAAGLRPGARAAAAAGAVPHGGREHQLVWTQHHLVLDGWSLSLIFRDVLAGYAAYARGETPQLGQARRYRRLHRLAGAAGPLARRAVLAGGAGRLRRPDSAAGRAARSAAGRGAGPGRGEDGACRWSARARCRSRRGRGA